MSQYFKLFRLRLGNFWLDFESAASASSAIVGPQNIVHLEIP